MSASDSVNEQVFLRRSVEASIRIGLVVLLVGELHDGTLALPPPPENVGSWPLVGDSVQKFWSLASGSLESALLAIKPQRAALDGWLLAKGAATGIGLLNFVASMLIAGFLLARADAGRAAAIRIATRLAAERGASFAELAGATVRSVARGILGVALIQAILAGMGMLAVGVIDSFLKSLLIGRGGGVPMLVIFIGAIGGFIFQGIVGLFVGAVVLGVSYNLFNAWLADAAPHPESAQPGASY